MNKTAVIMPTFNSEPYLKVAIDSVLNQSYRDFDFYIYDDGSLDNSYRIVQEYSDSRIQLFKGIENKGITFSLNFLISKTLSNYDFIFRMDSDDLSVDHRFKTQIDFMNSNPDIDILGSWVSFFGAKESVWHTPETDIEIKAKLFWDNALAHPTILIRTERIKEISKGFQYKDTFVTRGGWEDYEMWIRFSPHLIYHNIQESLLKRRVYDGKQLDVNLQTEFRKSFLHHIQCNKEIIENKIIDNQLLNCVFPYYEFLQKGRGRVDEKTLLKTINWLYYKKKGGIQFLLYKLLS